MEVFKQLSRFYWPYRRYFFGSILSLLFVTGLTVVYPIFLQLAIDEGIVNQNFSIIPLLSIGFIFIMLFKGIAAYFNQYLGDLFGIQTVYSLRQVLYDKLQFIPFRFYDNARTGDLMSRLTADVEGFRHFLSFGFAQLFNFVMIVAFSLSVMFYYSPQLALITMLMMPILAFTVHRFDKFVHPAFYDIRLSMASLNTRVQENVSGINTVKSLSRENFEMGRFEEKNMDYRDKYLYTSGIWARYFPVMEFIGNMAVVLLLAYGGYLAIYGTLMPGELVAFFSLVWYIMGPLTNLGFIINTFSQSKASGERLLEILNEEEDIYDRKNSITAQDMSGEVTFKKVNFLYPGENKMALKDINFQARAGEVIGLMGATGAGKSSITHLIARFYEPTEGEVLIDGVDNRNYRFRSLREKIGFVLQEPFLFSSTIRDNIAYGQPDVTMEHIMDAAKRAQAHEFIEALPHGYNTVLGERGMGLSGGQKQRISIARALLINPSILVLDDATSAVDMQTEFKIQAAFRELMRGRTTFIIAHRISSVQHADTILVLENGQIAERGTHEQLLTNDGLYRRIYDIQYQDLEAINA
ncbi:ABC-type multidrug transport system fused ATPase/permease subunit [Geomicrobium halophilum]|uniref:ABC-type multidrug transport system fused ATPase/permease subunit n=1 Tax=Geomicrobium halophilum TaxID=549000 RepID=A0A841PNG6_9BACL|nr:ABC transporter ATP-binding protein [Geomicrobium halophilum]MBB6449314.1 ABC-type multidrug transport system fused ATPase/permease subunit [Geomicrobium halophilum]